MASNHATVSLDQVEQNLTKLKYTINSPRLVIDEFFSDLGNKIDLYVECLLNKLDHSKKLSSLGFDKTQINANRQLMINVLYTAKINSLAKLPSTLNLSKMREFEHSHKILNDQFDELRAILKNELTTDQMHSQSLINLEQLLNDQLRALGGIIFLNRYYIFMKAILQEDINVFGQLFVISEYYAENKINEEIG